MADDYPDSDFPYTLYFQGVALPRWSNCWCFIKLRESPADWFVERVWGRIDHVGVIESEEAGIAIIAAQQVLREMIERPEECFQFDGASDGAPRIRSEVFAGVIGGLRRMIELAESEEVVFWTSGYSADLDRLREAVGKFRTGELTPPHRITWKREIEQEIWNQRRDLRRLAHLTCEEKDLRRFIHQLPRRT